MPAIPDYPHEVFPRRPLKTVICQFCFHEILRISMEPPAAFQALVGGDFPKVVRGQALGFSVVSGQLGPANTGSVWEFHTADDAYVVGLTTASISLESRQYTDFETFARFLAIALKGLLEVYQPAAFTRVGLRYVNEVIRFARTDERVDWSQWVSADLVPCILFDPMIASSINGSGHLVTFREPDGLINVRYGFQRGEVDSRAAEAFTLDIDYFAEDPIEPSEAMSRVTKFNSWNYRFFRWAVGEKLLEKMRQGNGTDDDEIILGAGAT